MKESQNICDLLGLDFVEKQNHGSVLKLYKDGIVVTISATALNSIPPRLEISVERGVA